MAHRVSSEVLGAGPPWARRRFLRSALLAGVAVTGTAVAGSGLAGCAVTNPRIGGTARPPLPQPTPTPTPTSPGSREGAATEGEQAAAVSAVVAGDAATALRPRQIGLLSFVAEAHRLHAVALRNPNPEARATSLPTPEPGATPPRASGPSSGSPSPSASTRGPRQPLDAVDIIEQLAEQERALAKSHTEAAVASTGPIALVWGSLGAAASSYALAMEVNATAPKAGTPEVNRPIVPLADVAAQQLMVRQLHSAIYGYQLALGHIPVNTPQHKTAIARLQEHRRTRDQLIAALTERGAEIPPAEPAYAPSEQPKKPEESAALVAQIEQSLTPFCGLWLASSSVAADRTLAMVALSQAATSAVYWGAPVEVWPGWAQS